ncbi:hypothetical protein DID78_01620 [Candidatus Marinamargulisbacteria bacterium SCGC AG-343-D04]|nr:hypothetical protein DID78_01620 [Candidatus Marinamargulisbacteria bacterium SCGC AG-343-D04]
MILILRALFLLLLVCVSSSFADDEGYVFINYLGGSQSFNSRLFLNVDGENNVSYVRADWDSRSLTDSLYYAMKLEKWNNKKGYGLEWVHHKIYLASTNDRLQGFSISDGLNFLFLNRVVPFKGVGEKKYFKDDTLRYGLGLVFAHMDVRLDDRERFYMDGGIRGSYFSGVAAQVSLEKWLKSFEKTFFTVETKFTMAYVRPPISTHREEYAELPNYAVHVLFGFGTKPSMPKTFKEGAKLFALPPLYMGGAGYFIRRIDEHN